MYQYLNLLETVRAHGDLRETRTGVKAISDFSPAPLVFDLSHDALPIVTTKRIPLIPLVGELLGFINGFTSAADFRNLDCKIWDANANDPGLPDAPNKWLTNPNRKGTDDLGRIYGAQWRDWRYMRNGREHTTDQLGLLVSRLRADPFSRYHLVSAWNPGELDQMALPPCHYAFQCYVRRDFDQPDSRILDMKVHMRSVDLFLGLPFNITSYAILQHMLANVTGYRAGRLTMDLGDVHIYENHLTQVMHQLRRTPEPATAKVIIGSTSNTIGRTCERRIFTSLDDIGVHNIIITGYEHQGALPAPMAV